MGVAGRDSRITGRGVNLATGPGALRRKRREAALEDAPPAPDKTAAGKPDRARATLSATMEMDPATRNILLESRSEPGGAASPEIPAVRQPGANYYKQGNARIYPHREVDI
jgi:hypothetical protein